MKGLPFKERFDMANETLSLLMNRKSVRAYESAGIPEDHVRAIL